MMKNIHVVVFAVGALLFLMGCTVPQFHSCCIYTNATENLCVLNNGTIYDTEVCDTSPDGTLTCNVTVREEGGEVSKLTLPICPARNEGECNVSCAGIFCGRYEYDPRPLFSTSDAVKLDEEGDPAPDAGKLAPGTGSDVAIGLYNSECRVENLTPAFLNAVSNGQGLTLNIFRFGVGNSFQEFDEASMYYPLTDKACKLNQIGTVDRYENYAVPNMLLEGGGAICREDAFGPGIWGCIPNLEIRSYSYFDCATRCLLEYSGDSAAVDPGNAYLTERNDQVLGNPFAYGVPDYGSSAIIQWAYSTPGSGVAGDVPSYLLLGRGIKGSAVPADAFSDDYSFGYTYYGAQFGKTNGDILTTVVDEGAPAFSTGTAYDYYYGQDSILERASLGGGIEENFLTIERDPHAIYAFLLSQHSVYGQQIWQGHYMMNGSWAPGAEFECTQAGGECISGFCNTQDYHRGACKRLVNAATGEIKEVNCGCREEGGETVCNGEALYQMSPWDRYDSGIRVNATMPLSAPVAGSSITSFFTFDVTQTVMPSKGKVLKYDVGGSGFADGEKDYVMVMQLGGLSKFPDYSSVDYDNDVAESTYQEETLTIPQVLSRKQWSGCSPEDECGKFYTTFVDECMPSASEDPGAYHSLSVCYLNNRYAGTYGSLFSPATGGVVDQEGLYGMGFGDNCRRLLQSDAANDYEAFCYERDNNGDCVLYSASVLMVIAREVEYTDASGTTVTGLAFGNCLFDEGGTRLDTTTYGYCEQCSFLTMAKEEIVALPEEQVDGYEKGDGTRLGNKYCPNLEISTLYPPWENGALQYTLTRSPDSWAAGEVHSASGSGEDNPYRYSECTMPDGTEVGKQVAWPDYLPNGYYLKSKIESYLKRNIQPVIFAEFPSFHIGVDQGLYSAGYGDDAVLSVAVKSDGKIDTGKTTSPFMVSLALDKMWLLDAMSDYVEVGDPTYYETGGTFLADSVMDQGPAIIVVKRLKEDDFGSAPPMGLSTGPGENIDWILGLAGRRIDLLCPDCMVSVAAGYDDIGSGIPARMYQISRMFEYTDATSGEPMWDYAYYGENASCYDEGVSCDYTALNSVDIIAVKWGLGGRNSHCDIEDEEERFGAILSDEMEFGAKVLRRFGKPLVVTDFTIIRNRDAIYDEGVRDCWTDETAKRFMIYLGQHTSDLVKSGHTGLIYSDWTDEHSGEAGTTYIRTEEGGVGGYRGEFFEGTFDAAALFAGRKEETFYSMVGVSEKCECIPCTSLDDPSVCNGKFLGTGPECYGYAEGTNVRWPPNCVSQDACIQPSSLPGYKVSCNVYYNNGTEAQEEFSGGEIAANPQLYPDVIASIKYGGKIPCMESSGKNISYMKMETGGYKAYPLLFRMDGNLSVDCAQPPLAAFGEACGVSLPVSERRMECIISPLDLRVELPPLGGSITVPPEAIGGAGIPGGAGIGGAGIGG